MRAKMAASIFRSTILLYFIALMLPFIPFIGFCHTAKIFNVSETCLFSTYSPGAISYVLKRSFLANTPTIPVIAWRRRGCICICLPPKDVTICMDVQANPGPFLSPKLADLRSRMPFTENSLHERPPPADLVYSREDLLSLRPRKFGREIKDCLHQLKLNGLLKYRGPRKNNRG